MDGESRYQPGKNTAKEKQPETVSKFNTEIQSLIDQKPFEPRIEQLALMDLQKGLKTYRIDGKTAPTLSLWNMASETEKINGNNLVSVGIKKHGRLIQKAAIYIANRVKDGTITLGMDRAQIFSEQLFNYGKSLNEGRSNTRTTPFEQIVEKEELDQQQSQIIEHLLGIDTFLETPTSQNDIELQRKSILRKFFISVGDNQRNMAVLSQDSDIVQDQYQANQIIEAIKIAIEKPARELEGSIILQGIKQSQETMSLVPLHVKEFFDWLGIKTEGLFCSLTIPKYRSKLEKHRNNIDLSNEKIGEKEISTAKKIRNATTILTGKERAKNHNRIHKPTNKEYHVLATTSGAIWMQQAGINCAIANIPDASGIFFMTTDGRVFSMDMTNPTKTFDVTENVQNSPLFKQSLKAEGLRMRNPKQTGEKAYLTLYPPKDGRRILTLFNKAIEYRNAPPIEGKDRNHAMDKFRNYQLSIKTFEKIITPNLQDEDIWYQYAVTLMKSVTDEQFKNTNIISNQNKNYSLQKAIDAFFQTTQLNHNNHQAYTHIAEILEMNSLDQEAAKFRKQAREAKKRQKLVA